MIDKLILGTVQLGLDYGINNFSGKPSQEEAFSILNYAYDQGLRKLDTAEAYGNSIDVIGAYHNAYPNKRFDIISKLSPLVDVAKIDLRSHVDKSLNILSIKQLYAYMFHSYNSLKSKPSLFNEFIELKNKGIVKNIGISVYTNDEIEDIIENFDEFDFIQIPFNLLDNSKRRKTLVEKAKQKDIDTHTRSTFLQGLFFKNDQELQSKLLPLKPYLSRLNSIANRWQIPIADLAIQYVLQKEYIKNVLIGVETRAQLESNLVICKKYRALDWTEVDEIDVKELDLLNPANWI
ncbi:MAG: aldo/keto reductase [Winogradskyella sp.]|uniref:aldo/keto reductase n=1 Tax=Winogradskyella sp. TaxID=1883156 RepID=UPI0017FB1D61|nr:aldo/keto reductase [Winogradskyella sp.]